MLFLLLLLAAWLLTLEAVLFLRLRGLLGFLQLLLFEGRQTGLGAAGVLVGVVALFLRLGGRGSRSREDVDLPDGTQQVADVVGQPVHQHCERHGDAGEDVHDREHPQHHLLHHFSLLVRSALGHVALHAVVLHEPQAEAHQRHEDADDDLAVDVGSGEVLGHVHAEHVGGGELLGGGDVEGAEAGTVPELATGDVWNGRQGVEHAHEHRTLHEHRQHRRAAAHRVRVVVLVELHHLTAHGLFAGLIHFALVLVLNMLHLGLQGLHLAHRLHLLVEQREDTSLHHQHQRYRSAAICCLILSYP